MSLAKDKKNRATLRVPKNKEISTKMPIFEIFFVKFFSHFFGVFAKKLTKLIRCMLSLIF